jgi:aminoglycoside phosphotransferase (APT) family kinase protein
MTQRHTTSEPDGFDSDLRRWVEETTQRSVRSTRRVLSGNRRRSWAVELDGDGPDVFVRFDPDPVDDRIDPYSIRREAEVYRSIAPSFPWMPAFVGVHPTRAALATACVAGESAYHHLPPDRRDMIGREFMQALGKLHSIEAVAVGFPEPEPPTVAGHIAAELSRWAGMYHATDRIDPLIEFGLAWVARHIPDVEEAPAVVHGDAGPGNFMFDEDHLTALVDWEFAHLGDPMEDLAWVSMRSVFEGFEHFPERLRDYEQAAGRTVDVDRVRFHRVLVQLRVAIVRHRAADDPDPSGDVANGLISLATNRRLLLEAWADASGTSLRPWSPPPVGASPHDWLFEALLTTLRTDIADRTTDPHVLTKSKSAARLVKYLRALDRSGRTFDNEQLDVLSDALGHPVGTVVEGEHELGQRIRDGQIEEGVAVDYLVAESQLENELMSSALGAIRDRHLPALTVEHEATA